MGPQGRDPLRYQFPGWGCFWGQPQSRGLVGVLDLQARGQSQNSVPGLSLHIQLPTVPTQGRAQASKRLQISLYNISAERNLSRISVGLRERAMVVRERPAGTEKTGCPRLREAGEDGRSSPGCDGRRPTVSRGEARKPPKGACHPQQAQPLWGQEGKAGSVRPIQMVGGSWWLPVAWPGPWWGHPPVRGKFPMRC